MSIDLTELTGFIGGLSALQTYLAKEDLDRVSKLDENQSAGAILDILRSAVCKDEKWCPTFHRNIAVLLDRCLDILDMSKSRQSATGFYSRMTGKHEACIDLLAELELGAWAKSAGLDISYSPKLPISGNGSSKELDWLIQVDGRSILFEVSARVTPVAAWHPGPISRTVKVTEDELCISDEIYRDFKSIMDKVFGEYRHHVEAISDDVKDPIVVVIPLARSDIMAETLAFGFCKTNDTGDVGFWKEYPEISGVLYYDQDYLAETVTYENVGFQLNPFAKDLAKLTCDEINAIKSLPSSLL